jgi:hypothetical protein
MPWILTDWSHIKEMDCDHDYEYWEDPDHEYTGYLERCTKCGDIIQIPQ